MAFTGTATSAIRKIQTQAKKSNNRLIYIHEFPMGHTVRQGDLYITRIKPGQFGKASDNFQLAPGNTKGSRHTAVGPVKVYFPTNPKDALEGPKLRATERFTIPHPDHKHFSLPEGCYQVTYQRDYEQEEIRRTMD